MVKIKAGAKLHLRLNGYIFGYKELVQETIFPVAYKDPTLNGYVIKINKGKYYDYFYVRGEDCEVIK